jgi:hypothetical protein
MFRGQLREVGELAAAAVAFSVALVALEPDPGDPGPPLALSFVVFGIAWVAAFIVLERRVPWRRGAKPRTEPRLLVMAAFLLVAVVASLVVVGMLYVPEIPPVSRSTWIYDSLLEMFVIWCGAAAVILTPRREVLLGRREVLPGGLGSSEPDADDSAAPRFRWPR